MYKIDETIKHIETGELYSIEYKNVIETTFCIHNIKTDKRYQINRTNLEKQFRDLTVPEKKELGMYI